MLDPFQVWFKQTKQRAVDGIWVFENQHTFQNRVERKPLRM
jgi:hypothetical protein